MANDRILVIDDEVSLAEIIRDYLQNEGFEVTLCFDGESGLKAFEDINPQLVILDIMLPVIDGMEFCRKLRKDSTIPVIMMSARGSDIDKILGLGLGADDYIVKPFNMMELIARAKAQLRRYTQFSTTNISIKSNNATFGNMTIDYDSYTVHVDNVQATLAAKEFELLAFLSKHPHRVFTKEQLFDNVWGYYEYGDINTVTVHIRKIREKIEENPAEPKFIKTVWGVGYKFEGATK